jgi:hypothetical protein
MEAIVNTLNQLNNIKNINCGGCGIVALSMYRWLKKNKILPKDFKIFYLYREHSKYLYDLNTSGNCLGANHIVIRCNGKLFDSTGERFFYEYEYCHTVTIKHLIKSLNNIEEWNELFNRNLAINVIENLLNIKLNDVL